MLFAAQELPKSLSSFGEIPSHHGQTMLKGGTARPCRIANIDQGKRRLFLEKLFIFPDELDECRSGSSSQRKHLKRHSMGCRSTLNETVRYLLGGGRVGEDD